MTYKMQSRPQTWIEFDPHKYSLSDAKSSKPKSLSIQLQRNCQLALQIRVNLIYCITFILALITLFFEREEMLIKLCAGLKVKHYFISDPGSDPDQTFF